MNSIIVIPARLHSKRLRRKLLLSNTGKPLLWHTWQAARESSLASRIYIATDSKAIVQAAELFGAKVILSTTPHANGTSRIAEAASILDQTERCRIDSTTIIVNLQGDEPGISGRDIDMLIRNFSKSRHFDVATLGGPLSESDNANLHAVKVQVDRHGCATRFARQPIPDSLHHIGIYAYAWDNLPSLALESSQSRIARDEGLEQLGWMQANRRVQVTEISESPPGINTKTDYESFAKKYNASYRVSPT